MSKVVIPANLKGKELYKFLIANKDAIIAQKKAYMKRCDPVEFAAMKVQDISRSAIKADKPGETTAPEDNGVLRVKVVANTALWCDSHMDVLLPDNAKKSLKERKGMIPHLHDHKWEMDAEVGDVANIYYQDIELKELGLNKPGTAQCLIFETDIREDYNPKVYSKYKAGKVKQHSIGLFYVTLELAINDSDYEKEQDFWNKYIDQVINKEVCEDAGYFWVVSEIKLVENSAVLFGSNILTPTLADEDKSDITSTEPLTSTPPEPKKSATPPKQKGIDYSKLATRFFPN